MEITINDKTFNIRSLTRGEVKAQKKAGLSIGSLTPENADEYMDTVLNTVLGEDAVDNLPNPDAMKLYKAIITATYGGGEDEKNSLSSGDGTADQTDQTANDQNS